MNFPFRDLLTNVAWQALTNDHAALAISAPLARRYPADVVPFAGLRELNPIALAELRELMLPGEEIFVAWTGNGGDALPTCRGMKFLSEINALQMIWPEGASFGASGGTAVIEPLDAANGPEMVALTDVAFPGFFRARTYRMGSYWGIRAEGELIAMAGERMALPGLREVSAVCTRPGHTGRGYAAQLIRHVLAEHLSLGLRSFLHVTDTNVRAIALYERLGFLHFGATRVTRVRRV